MIFFSSKPHKLPNLFYVGQSSPVQVLTWYDSVFQESLALQGYIEPCDAKSHNYHHLVSHPYLVLLWCS